MVTRHVEITPALLCTTKEEFLEKLKRIEPYVTRAQYDVMDGRFAHNTTVQPKALRKLYTPVRIEVQLMVQHPAEYLHDCCRMNAWMVTFHYESLKDKKAIIALIHQIRAHKLKVGIAINPVTPAAAIKPYLTLVDLVLVMTVQPGRGGQKLIPRTLKKVTQLRAWAPHLDIEVDGGINKDTAPLAIKAGANVLVAGKAILNATSVPHGIGLLMQHT